MSEPSSQLTTTEEPRQKIIVQASERGMRFETMNEMWKFCVAVVNSGQIKDITTPEIALIRLQAGMELGLTPIWSLTNIMVTNGRPSVWGDALLGIVLARPECEDVIETFTGKFPDDSFTAVCEVRRKGRLPVIREFSIGDAKKANLFGKNVHGLYPKRMLAMRARAFACRDAFADALRGLGVREEMQDIEPRKIEARVVSREMVLGESPTEIPTESAGAVSESSNAGSASVDLIPEDRAKVKCDSVSPGHVEPPYVPARAEDPDLF